MRAPPTWPVATLVIVGVIVLIEAAVSVAGARGLPAREWVLLSYGQERRLIWDGEYWRLLTCTFLHGHWLHLAINAFGAFLFGRIVERWLGGWRFLGWYLFFAVAGSLSYQAFAAGFRPGDIVAASVGVGASGAVCGLIGLFLVGRTGRRSAGEIVLGRRFWTWLFFAVVLLYLDSVFAERVLFGGAQIADSAHFGGLAAGVLGGAYCFSARGAPGVRRKLRVAVVTGALVVGVGAYGLAFPVFDWTWYLWRIARTVDSGDIDRDLLASFEERARHLGGDAAGVEIIALKVKRKEVAEALDYWVQRPLASGRAQLAAGVAVYDGLYVSGHRAQELWFVLDRLIELADREIAAHPHEPAFLNDAAWFRALRGADLDTALAQAAEAVDTEPGEPSFLNTLGWVHFQRGELEAALRYLMLAVEKAEEATRSRLVDSDSLRVRRAALGPNCLYLGLALWQNGKVVEARRFAVSARKLAVELQPHELVMLDELEAALGHGRLRVKSESP
jgi:membrane associated rhomboid family serine protease